MIYNFPQHIVTGEDQTAIVAGTENHSFTERERRILF